MVLGYRGQLPSGEVLFHDHCTQRSRCNPQRLFLSRKQQRFPSSHHAGCILPPQPCYRSGLCSLPSGTMRSRAAGNILESTSWTRGDRDRPRPRQGQAAIGQDKYSLLQQHMHASDSQQLLRWDERFRLLFDPCCQPQAGRPTSEVSYKPHPC